MENRILGWFLLLVIFLALPTLGAYFLWRETLSNLGISFWKVELGMIVVTGVAMWVLQDTSEITALTGSEKKEKKNV